MSLRKDNLSYKIHEVVAPLDPKEQDKWIAGSVEMGTRVHQIPFRHYREIAIFEPAEGHLTSANILYLF